MTAQIISLTTQENSLPHSLEAEKALLGSLLLNNIALENVVDFLKSDHFSENIHGKIYESIVRLHERGHIADPITLKEYFHKDETLQPVGGAQYLIDLVDSVIHLGSTADYGRLIYDLSLRRQLIHLGEEVIRQARSYSLEQTAIHQIEQAEKQLYDLATKGQISGGFQPFDRALTEAIQMAERAYKRESRVVGVSTGLIDLDKWLGGLHPSDLIIIAGRPSMGKTALATNIAFNTTHLYLTNPQDGACVAFFSLEMSAEQLAARILASETSISSDKIRRGEIKHDDFPRFIEVSHKLSQIPLYIDDTPALSVAALRNRSRRLKRQHGLGLIVIDYLQLLSPDGTSRRQDSRVQEISEITRSLKALAKELEVPVVALSQLSRAVEQREDKRPQLADLRESGSIEQDADVVMFVFREEYYEARRQPPPGTDKHLKWCQHMDEIHNKAEIILAKQRHGPVGMIKLFFEGSITKFGNLVETP